MKFNIIQTFLLLLLSGFVLLGCTSDGITDKDVMKIVDEYRQTEFRKATGTYETPMANFLARDRFEDVEKQLMNLKVDILSKDEVETDKYQIRIFVSGLITESITTGMPKTHDVQRQYLFEVRKVDRDFLLIEESVEWMN